MPELKYQSGFGNHFETEAVAGSLPIGRNSPQKVGHGLYAEQLSGSSFTAPREDNKRSWLYRILPSVKQSRYAYAPLKSKLWLSSPVDRLPAPPDPLRWDPLPFPSAPKDFIDGLTTVCASGDAAAQTGCAVHLYAFNKPMGDQCFYDADGELMLVPQEGELKVTTEFGILEAKPGEIIVIPRGIKFSVENPQGQARGYVGENYGRPFRLPHLGPIGANGLANPRDFLTPVAAFEDKDKKKNYEMITKFNGHLWRAELDHSPFDVVAWHGNYYPYKYDLARFQVVNSVSFDHPDPSIFTVLTSPSDTAGVANVDFVIFPPRWVVAENTFRPPYYHRNIMSEYMGLIHGVYDAKPGGASGGFVPGGGSLHNCMSSHGPDAAAFEAASSAELKPKYMGFTLAFMFETRTVFKPTPWALETPILQRDYLDCWKDLQRHFN